jgi:threonine dehydrogenase-like Zn-dependent dehydrogenase
MRGAVLYGPRDVRFDECDAPMIIKPSDAIIRISAACVCGSDLCGPARRYPPKLIDLVGELGSHLKPGSCSKDTKGVLPPCWP